MMSLMPVYYGGDLCTSDESDWEDPYDIACAKYVEHLGYPPPAD